MEGREGKGKRYVSRPTSQERNCAGHLTRGRAKNKGAMDSHHVPNRKNKESSKTPIFVDPSTLPNDADMKLPLSLYKRGESTAKHHENVLKSHLIIGPGGLGKKDGVPDATVRTTDTAPSSATNSPSRKRISNTRHHSRESKRTYDFYPKPSGKAGVGTGPEDCLNMDLQLTSEAQERQDKESGGVSGARGRSPTGRKRSIYHPTEVKKCFIDNIHESEREKENQQPRQKPPEMIKKPYKPIRRIVAPHLHQGCPDDLLSLGTANPLPNKPSISRLAPGQLPPSTDIVNKGGDKGGRKLAPQSWQPPKTQVGEGPVITVKEPSNSAQYSPSPCRGGRPTIDLDPNTLRAASVDRNTRRSATPTRRGMNIISGLPDSFAAGGPTSGPSPMRSGRAGRPEGVTHAIRAPSPRNRSSPGLLDWVY